MPIKKKKAKRPPTLSTVIKEKVRKEKAKKKEEKPAFVTASSSRQTNGEATKPLKPSEYDGRGKEYQKPVRENLSKVKKEDREIFERKGEGRVATKADTNAIRRIRVYDSTQMRDISEVPKNLGLKPLELENINWERRMACKADPELDLQTYFPELFYYGLGDLHKELIREIEDRMADGGKKIIAFPRGTGKTTICRSMIVRAVKYGMRDFCFFIGSREDKAQQTLSFVKGQLFRNSLLQQDFPEFCYPVYRIEGRGGAALQGQIYKGERTHMEWKADELQTATMLFTRSDVENHLKYDPESVLYVERYDRFIIKGAGTVIRVAGIDGSIRGEVELHPILLNQPRPDLILLDDIIKDQKADSPKSCEDLERLIESAISYLSAPGVPQAIIWPGTVIREDDPTDNYLNKAKHYEWAGKRISLIEKYPEGIDDYTIAEDTEQGSLWLKYSEVLKNSYLQHDNLKLANEFYREHREVMSAGFKVCWEEFFIRESKNPDKNEVDAIQSAMNRRFRDHISFLSEAQNNPSSRVENSSILLQPGEVAEKVTRIPRGELSVQWDRIVAFIDIQDEIFFYMVFACDHAFNGQFIDYGTFPEVNTSYIRKNQTLGWSLLTRLYYKDHPDEKEYGKSGAVKLTRNRTTKVRAPFDHKIYHALKLCCTDLLSRKYIYQDEHANTLSIKCLGIDTKWGKASDICKRFIREFNHPAIIAYQGHPFLPSHKQLEEYELRPGWLFEHQQFPGTRESKWVFKPYQDNSGKYLFTDVNRYKNFLMKRLGTPAGGQGCVSLFWATPEQHAMVADHITRSEYPEPIAARGMTKDCWQPRPTNRDENDYLDAAVGCMALASLCGASIKTEGETSQTVRPVRNLRQAYEAKKRRQALTT